MIVLLGFDCLVKSGMLHIKKVSFGNNGILPAVRFPRVPGGFYNGHVSVVVQAALGKGDRAGDFCASNHRNGVDHAYRSKT